MESFSDFSTQGQSIATSASTAISMNHTNNQSIIFATQPLFSNISSSLEKFANASRHNGTDIISDQLPPQLQKAGTHAVIAVVLTIGFLVGMVVNPLVINLFRKEKKLYSFTNMYVLALSTSDMLMTMVGLSTSAISNCFGRWVFGHAGCVLHGFAVTFLGLTNLNLFTAIAIDRYLVIVRPHLRSRMSSRAIKMMIFLCYSVALLWALLPLGGWSGVSNYTYEGVQTSCSLDWMSEKTADKVYVSLLFVVFFAVPVIIICIAYTGVYRKVRDSHSATTSIATNPTLAAKNLLLERKLALTFVLVFACFLVSWTPYAVVSLITVLGYSELISPLAATIPAILAKVAVVWNPLIYVATNQIVRNCFIELYYVAPSTYKNGVSKTGRATSGATRSQVSAAQVVPIDAIGELPNREYGHVKEEDHTTDPSEREVNNSKFENNQERAHHYTLSDNEDELERGRHQMSVSKHEGSGIEKPRYSITNGDKEFETVGPVRKMVGRSGSISAANFRSDSIVGNACTLPDVH